MSDAKFVVFDGMDGSGKGTQIEMLRKKLRDRPVVFTREPGGPPLAEEIRKMLLDLAGQSTPLFHFLLFWAAREESMQKLVMPALQAGKHVFSDRGDSSTYAFQLYGEDHLGLFGAFALLRKLAFAEHNGRRQPDLYIVFDLPAEKARERALRDAVRTKTHFDERDVSYYERVRKGFHRLAGYLPTALIDASQSPEDVHRSVITELVRAKII